MVSVPSRGMRVIDGQKTKGQTKTRRLRVSVPSRGMRVIDKYVIPITECRVIYAFPSPLGE